MLILPAGIEATAFLGSSLALTDVDSEVTVDDLCDLRSHGIKRKWTDQQSDGETISEGDQQQQLTGLCIIPGGEGGPFPDDDTA